MDYNVQQVLDAIAYATQSDVSDIQPIEDATVMLAELRKLDRHIEQAYCRWFREASKDRVAHHAVNHEFEECERLMGYLKIMCDMDAQTDIDAFMQAMEWNREPEDRFWQPRRRCMMDVCWQLQDLFDRRLEFLSISLPPRVGKTTICTFFLVMCMGNNPDDSCAMGGYNDELAGSFHAEILSFVEDRAGVYRFSEIFPDSPFKGRSMDKKTVDLRHAHTRFHTVFCRGVGGTWTGAVEIGGNGILYCDDLVKKREESLNDSLMQKLYSAYLGEMKDRKKKGARELFVGTRWVPNDPIGRIEEQHGSDPMYRFFSKPALDDDGNSNFMFDVEPFDNAYYYGVREDLIAAGDEDEWWAKYMGRPYRREGALYDIADLRMFSDVPEQEPDNIVAVCDTKTKGSDYCVMPIVEVYGNDHYVVDVVCSDSPMERITPRLVDMLCSHGVMMCRFESNVAGGTIAQDVEKQCLERGLSLDMRTKYSTENKETRIEADAGWVKQNCLFSLNANREYATFLKFLTTYSLKGKNKHDDVPDAMSMYKRFIDSTAMARIIPMHRLW